MQLRDISIFLFLHVKSQSIVHLPLHQSPPRIITFSYTGLLVSNSTDVVMNFLDKGFEVKWGGVGEHQCHACISSGGICDFKNSKNTCLLNRSLSSKGLSSTRL